VAEPERLALAHVREVDHVGNLADLSEQFLLAARLEKGLELDRDIEVILDRVLAAASDQDDVVDSGRNSLLDTLRADRLVDEREHLLGLCLGGGQEARTQSGSRENGLSNPHHRGDRSRTHSGPSIQ